MVYRKGFGAPGWSDDIDFTLNSRLSRKATKYYLAPFDKENKDEKV
jgi:hypothetical protein